MCSPEEETTEEKLPINNYELQREEEATISADMFIDNGPLTMDHQGEATPSSGLTKENEEKFMQLHCQAPKQVAIALAGRVPVKVVGNVKEGDLLMVSETEGHAEVLRGEGWVIGRALEGTTCQEGRDALHASGEGDKSEIRNPKQIQKTKIQIREKNFQFPIYKKRSQ